MKSVTSQGKTIINAQDIYDSNLKSNSVYFHKSIEMAEKREKAETEGQALAKWNCIFTCRSQGRAFQDISGAELKAFSLIRPQFRLNL